MFSSSVHLENTEWGQWQLHDVYASCSTLLRIGLRIPYHRFLVLLLAQCSKKVREGQCCRAQLSQCLKQVRGPPYSRPRLTLKVSPPQDELSKVSGRHTPRRGPNSSVSLVFLTAPTAQGCWKVLSLKSRWLLSLGLWLPSPATPK